MSTQIKYKNFFGVEITHQQTNQLDEYAEQTYVDNRKKIEKKYFENELEYIYIYIYPNEDVNAILSTLTEPDLEYTIVKDFEQINGYDTWKYFAYENGVLDSEYTMEVFDAQGRGIAIIGYDENGAINFPGWKKYYISNNILYDENGDIDIKYDDESYVKFNFMNGELEISLPLDDEVIYKSSDMSRFAQAWLSFLPLLSPELLAYFMNPNQLIPPANLNIV
jgi:hypothetical protein